MERERTCSLIWCVACILISCFLTSPLAISLEGRRRWLVGATAPSRCPNNVRFGASDRRGKRYDCYCSCRSLLLLDSESMVLVTVERRTGLTEYVRFTLRGCIGEDAVFECCYVSCFSGLRRDRLMKLIAMKRYVSSLQYRLHYSARPQRIAVDTPLANSTFFTIFVHSPCYIFQALHNGSSDVFPVVSSQRVQLCT